MEIAKIILLIIFAVTMYLLGKEMGHYDGWLECDKEDEPIINYYESQIKLLEQSNEYLERKLNECYKSA